MCLLAMDSLNTFARFSVLRILKVQIQESVCQVHNLKRSVRAMKVELLAQKETGVQLGLRNDESEVCPQS